jgi:hypothetical protein
MEDKLSLSAAFNKHIGYLSEEYIKQLVMEITSSKVDTLKPFVGSISYPSDLFPAPDSGVVTTQFGATTYIGFTEMIFPDPVSVLEDLPAFTVVQFKLDGIYRQFLTVAGGDILADTLKFSDYVNSLYPKANQPIPFNQSSLHIISDFTIFGGKFNVVPYVPAGAPVKGSPKGGVTLSGAPAGSAPAFVFQSTGFSAGSHTKDYFFCVAVGGYSVIII